MTDRGFYGLGLKVIKIIFVFVLLLEFSDMVSFKVRGLENVV